MSPTPNEMKGVQRVLAYAQPRCPTCNETMHLWWGADPSGITYGAYYECRNVKCEAQWHTYPKHSVNLASACLDAWKAATNRYVDKEVCSVIRNTLNEWRDTNDVPVHDRRRREYDGRADSDVPSQERNPEAGN